MQAEKASDIRTYMKDFLGFTALGIFLEIFALVVLGLAPFYYFSWYQVLYGMLIIAMIFSVFAFIYSYGIITWKKLRRLLEEKMYGVERR